MRLFQSSCFKANKTFYKKNNQEDATFNRIVQGTFKICQGDFLKLAVSKKRTALFTELLLQSLPQPNYQGNKMFKRTAQSAVKFVSETLARKLFKFDF